MSKTTHIPDFFKGIHAEQFTIFRQKKIFILYLRERARLKRFFAETNSSKCPKKEKRGGKQSKGSQKDGKPKVKC